mmetsp:Transcript_48421/g.92631  ORF Transcript_48421/g.92631 Transcript_48421/m.92631 type:complete len:387 (-) Transcript_48421:272-1432(-)
MRRARPLAPALAPVLCARLRFCLGRTLVLGGFLVLARLLLGGVAGGRLRLSLVRRRAGVSWRVLRGGPRGEQPLQYSRLGCRLCVVLLLHWPGRFQRFLLLLPLCRVPVGVWDIAREFSALPLLLLLLLLCGALAQHIQVTILVVVFLLLLRLLLLGPLQRAALLRLHLLKELLVRLLDGSVVRRELVRLFQILKGHFQIALGVVLHPADVRHRRLVVVVAVRAHGVEHLRAGVNAGVVAAQVVLALRLLHEAVLPEIQHHVRARLRRRQARRRPLVLVHGHRVLAHAHEAIAVHAKQLRELVVHRLDGGVVRAKLVRLLQVRHRVVHAASLGVVRRPADARRRSNVLSHGVRDGVEQVRAGANAIVVHPQHVQALRQLQLTSGPD